jgi:hypothetical protein
VTPEDVVEDARPIDSPMHDAFEWDDSKAAIEYRLEQARHLIRSVTFQVIANERTTMTRAFVVVRNEEQARDLYFPTDEAMSDEAMRKQVLVRALRDLQAFQHRYRELEELSVVFDAAQKVLATVAKPTI